MRAPRLFLHRPDRPLADWLGLSGSTLCLLHCLASPIVFGAAVAAGWHVAWLDWLFAGIALVAVAHTARTTTLPLVRHLLVGGLVVFALGFGADALLHDAGPAAAEAAADWFHVPGAALMLIGHLLNLRHVLRCRTGACTHPHHLA